MANNLQNNPIVLDAVMAAGYQDSVPAPPNGFMIYPRIIHWDNPTTAGHQFRIDDAGGNILFTATAKAAGQGEYFDVAEGVRWPDLWKLVTLQSGVLYIYFTT